MKYNFSNEKKSSEDVVTLDGKEFPISNVLSMLG